MPKFDLICLGRLAVDFYSDQVGSSIEGSQSFSKYLGGSSGNIAYGTARQGLRVSMLARVGNDQLGRFLCNTLESVGVDTSHLVSDSRRLTGLVVLGIKNQNDFPLLFYRRDCADMAIDIEDFDEAYIASSKALLITGTHFSTAHVKSTSLKALEYAKKNGVKRILDIDYRPTLWGLGSLDDGENRFIASEEVSQHLQEILPHFDLIVGTEEEFMIAGGNDEILPALKEVRRHSQATLVLKRGAEGNSVFEGEIPDDLYPPSTPIYSGVRVSVLNVLGAGDAFMSGYLRGWINNEDPKQCSRYANACGALVVSRHGCAPAIPSKEELDYYLLHENEILFPDQNVHLNHLHRVTTRTRDWKDLVILAFDHRIQFEEIIEEMTGNTLEKNGKEVVDLIQRAKQIIYDSFVEVVDHRKLRGQAGLLVDGRYGQSILNDATETNLWIARPVEFPKSKPLRFEYASVGSEIRSWPKEQVVKCLVFEHPNEDPAIAREQDDRIKEIYQACLDNNNELLLEVISSEEGADETVLPELMEHYYQMGIKPDWWKLFPKKIEEWQAITELIEREDPYCRGVLLLGLNTNIEKLQEIINIAKQYPICKGFAVGRSIFYEPVRTWLQNGDDAKMKTSVAGNFNELIDMWQK